MIRIYPDIDIDVSCPEDGANLDITRVVIPGMRALADCICPTCGCHYFVDLPIGEAIRHPISLKQESAEIFDHYNVTWFSNLLLESFLHPDVDDIEPIVHKFFTAERIVIVNCLDFLYGHSLLKLLNVQRYLTNHKELGCCVLVPSQLMHLVPDGVAEIWEFPLSVKDGWKWYSSLDRWLRKQIEQRKECFLSCAYSHPSNNVYELRQLIKNLPDITNDIAPYGPVILFNYREDRLWGSSLVNQQRNIQKLYASLSLVLPDMLFVLVGFGKENKFHCKGSKLLDLRADIFSSDQDKMWLAYMSKADCVIGVHGSNMLLPSGLAKSIVELVPRSRLGNTVQDFLFSNDKKDVREALLKYRMLYGNEELSNIQPSVVADMAINLVSYSPYNYAWFQVGEIDGAAELLDSIRNESVFKQGKKHLRSWPVESLVKRKLRRFAEMLLEAID